MQILTYALISAAFAAACFLLTSLVRRFALSRGIIAKRDARRRHDRNVPLLGGTAFYALLSIMTAVCAFVPSETIGTLSLSPRLGICFLLAIGVIYLVGAIDDCRELRAPPKFLAQFAAATLILFASPELPVAFQDLDLPKWLVATGLVFWMVGITNAMNMIDGLDGLCAGITGICAFTIAMIMLSVGVPFNFSVLLALAVAGCCAGFLFHNFNPARIFLGDSGSMLLGFVLAVISIQLEVKRTLMVSLSLPIFLLGLPLIDIVLSMIRRKRQKRSMFQGDRSHLHHRLQQMGLSHRGAVIFLWCSAGYLNLVAYFLAQNTASQYAHIYMLVVPTLILWFASIVFVERRLSFQAAQFGHLFVQQSEFLFPTKDEIETYVQEQIQRSTTGDRKNFIVITIECSDFLKQISQESPSKIIEFYMKLYAFLKGRLRGADLVARVNETRIVAILEGTSADGTAEKGVIEFIASHVRQIQESYGIFQSHPTYPEGFRVFAYPRDRKQIFSQLQIESIGAAPSAEKAA